MSESYAPDKPANGDHFRADSTKDGLILDDWSVNTSPFGRTRWMVICRGMMSRRRGGIGGCRNAIGYRKDYEPISPKRGNALSVNRPSTG
jgi:hypothetical protein